MRSLLVAAALTLAVPALAASPGHVPAAPPAKKSTVAMHYPTLEKMLRRFSRQAGESRTRG
jgi:ABC-type sugar transport system substrate-binding protein